MIFFSFVGVRGFVAHGGGGGQWGGREVIEGRNTYSSPFGADSNQSILFRRARYTSRLSRIHLFALRPLPASVSREDFRRAVAALKSRSSSLRPPPSFPSFPTGNPSSLGRAFPPRRYKIQAKSTTPFLSSFSEPLCSCCSNWWESRHTVTAVSPTPPTLPGNNPTMKSSTAGQQWKALPSFYLFCFPPSWRPALPDKMQAHLVIQVVVGN